MKWTGEEIDQVVGALCVTIELVGGRPLSDAATSAYIGALTEHDAAEVLRALKKCQLECRGRLPLGEVIDRIRKPARQAEVHNWDAEWKEASAGLREALGEMGPEGNTVRGFLGMPLVPADDAIAE